MKRVWQRTATAIVLLLGASGTASALEPNATDRMREISEIIVCDSHVGAAAMGAQGQPLTAQGSGGGCGRSGRLLDVRPGGRTDTREAAAAGAPTGEITGGEGGGVGETSNAKKANGGGEILNGKPYSGSGGADGVVNNAAINSPPPAPPQGPPAPSPEMFKGPPIVIVPPMVMPPPPPRPSPGIYLR